MPLARKKPGGGIEPDPSGAGEIDLGPCMQVSEISRRSFGTFQRFDVGLELDEIAGDEARGEAEMPERLDHQIRAVAARSAAQRQRFLTRLNPGFEANDVSDRVHQALIDRDEKIDAP